MDSLVALHLVEECLGLIRLKQDFEVIHNLIDEYKEALTEFYEGWADDLAERAVRVTNEFQWFQIRDGALQELERAMVEFGNERLAEAFGLGLTGDMTAELEYALQKEIAVNNTWIKNSLIPNIRLLSERYWENQEEYPEKEDIKGIWLRRAYQVGLYAGAAWTAYWAGTVTEKPVDTYWLWEGPADNVSCPTCLGRVGQVYRADQLPGLPGDISSECGCGCRCFLLETNIEELL